MPHEGRPLKDAEGAVVGFACGPGARTRQPCRWCGKPSTKLCDWPLPKGTCDAPMCDGHATAIGWNKDHCPEHVAARKLPAGQDSG
mgnify:FL=1